MPVGLSTKFTNWVSLPLDKELPEATRPAFEVRFLSELQERQLERVMRSRKDELLIESLSEAFREIAGRLAEAAEKSQPGMAWKAIVKAYLSPEHCDHAEWGCPLAALAPELARADKSMKAQILGELVRYKSRMLPFMPGRRAADKERAFVVIISTMLGAVAIARILPDQAARERVLASTRDFLLHSF